MLFTAAASTRLLISVSSRFRSICLTVKAMEKPAGGRAKLIDRVQKKPVQKKPALQKKPVQEKPGSAEEAELVKQSLVSTLMESSQSQGTFPEPSQSQGGATLNMMSPWMTDSQPDSLIDSQPDSLQAEIAELVYEPADSEPAGSEPESSWPSLLTSSAL